MLRRKCTAGALHATKWSSRGVESKLYPRQVSAASLSTISNISCGLCETVRHHATVAQARASFSFSSSKQHEAAASLVNGQTRSAEHQSLSPSPTIVPTMRPITALYGQRLYHLEAVANMGTRTLYETGAAPNTTPSSSKVQTSTSEASSQIQKDSESQQVDSEQPQPQQQGTAGEERLNEDDAEALKKTLRAKRKHVNKYMNPELAAKREEELRQLKQAVEGKGGGAKSATCTSDGAPVTAPKRQPVLAVKPVLRYPMLQQRPNILLNTPSASTDGALSASFNAAAFDGFKDIGISGGTASSSSSSLASSTSSAIHQHVIGGLGRDLPMRKQYYLSNVKAPRMVVLEVTELGSEGNGPSTFSNINVGNGNNQTNGCSGNTRCTARHEGASGGGVYVKEVHHVAVFNDGTVIGFGLSDHYLRRIRTEILDPHSDAKDVMLTADKEVIRLAANTNLCVFPAVDGDEASVAATIFPGSSSAEDKAPNGHTSADSDPQAPSASIKSKTRLPITSRARSVVRQGSSTLFSSSSPSSSLFSSAAAIHRLARNKVGTDISLRYRYTTVDALVKAEIAAAEAAATSERQRQIKKEAATDTTTTCTGTGSATQQRVAAENTPHQNVVSTDASGAFFSSAAAATASAAAIAAKSAGGSYIDDTTLEAVVLSENNATSLLPFAFCFYELIQLRALNALVFPIHEKLSEWQHHVAEKGTLPMSLKDARVLKAKLMRISSRHTKIIARRHRLLWEDHHTQARQVFEDAAEHFELSARSEAFRRRTDSMQGALAYLCDQAHGQKDIILEWVIIILIAVEVYIAMKAHAHDYDDEKEKKDDVDSGAH